MMTALEIAEAGDMSDPYQQSRTLGAITLCRAGLGGSKYATQYASGNSYWETPTGHTVATFPDGQWHTKPPVTTPGD